MKHISSAQNPIYKNLKALAASAKVRREQNQTILEGVHLADSYLQTNAEPLNCVMSQSAQENPEVSVLVSRCEALNVPVLLLSDQQFRTLSSVDNGVGLLLVIEQPSVDTPAVLDQSAALLDSVQDPGNVGAILRTAAAAGLTTVYCSPQTAAIWSPKVLRAGMGAHFALTIHENVDLATVVSAATIPVYATTLQATQSIYEVDLSGPAAWIVGNEGQGVSATLLNANVQQVIIPQNPKVESLNVAAATAVCLFEQQRQVRAKA